jgi:hypothetical protein
MSVTEALFTKLKISDHFCVPAGPKSPVKKMNVWEVEENKFNSHIT